MRHLRFIIASMVLTGLVFGSFQMDGRWKKASFRKKDGRWEYLPSEDPGLKYLLLKGIIIPG